MHDIAAISERSEGLLKSRTPMCNYASLTPYFQEQSPNIFNVRREDRNGNP
jgi:hypothetical protein